MPPHEELVLEFFKTFNRTPITDKTSLLNENLKNVYKPAVEMLIRPQKYIDNSWFEYNDDEFDDILTDSDKKQIDDYICKLTINYKILENVWEHKTKLVLNSPILNNFKKYLYFVFNPEYNEKENSLYSMLYELNIICNLECFNGYNLINKETGVPIISHQYAKYRYLCHKMSKYLNYKILKNEGDYRKEPIHVLVKSIKFIDICFGDGDYDDIKIGNNDILHRMEICLIGVSNDVDDKREFDPDTYCSVEESNE